MKPKSQHQSKSKSKSNGLVGIHGIDPMIETETTEETSACPQADGMSLREMWADLEDGAQMSDRLRLSQRQQQSQQEHPLKSNRVDESGRPSRGTFFGLFRRK